MKFVRGCKFHCREFSWLHRHKSFHIVRYLKDIIIFKSLTLRPFKTRIIKHRSESPSLAKINRYVHIYIKLSISYFPNFSYTTMAQCPPIVRSVFVFFLNSLKYYNNIIIRRPNTFCFVK